MRVFFLWCVVVAVCLAACRAIPKQTNFAVQAHGSRSTASFCAVDGGYTAVSVDPQVTYAARFVDDGTDGDNKNETTAFYRPPTGITTIVPIKINAGTCGHYEVRNDGAAAFTATVSVAFDLATFTAGTEGLLAGATSSAWPGPSNTGVPVGTSLTVHNGDLVINQAGTVVDGLDITGHFVANAPNVTIKRSKVHHGIKSNSTGLLIEDVELGVPSGKAGDDELYLAGLSNGGFTCRRCNIHNFGDAIRSGSNRDVILEDSWLHDFWYQAGDHNDGIQRYAPHTTSNDVIRHNRIDCKITNAAAVGIKYCTTSAIFYADYWEGTLRVDNNLLSGGGYTLRIHESGDAYITNNRFIRNDYEWGPTSNTNGSIVQWSGNVFDDNGEVINP